ncbi:hypothetical protein A5320_04715 [Rheinheimera sp. SA_1]|jgi:hypothetical protein|uniref:hypothetical protein n=1 Tax=Rheinheimera sp. SA_1 TaxID=1827365 RepID=UPI0007FFC0D6|nr:hypothetical protein [Rheinheimera sp. SA_1]OBP16693.1 hypothetical protein A5320_04715 [Rheinheimera sp. SA_1]
MKNLVLIGLVALSAFGMTAVSTIAVAQPVAQTTTCQWQFDYSERVGSQHNYTVLDWYRSNGACGYSRKAYNHRTSSWMYF